MPVLAAVVAACPVHYDAATAATMLQVSAIQFSIGQVLSWWPESAMAAAVAAIPATVLLATAIVQPPTGQTSPRGEGSFVVAGPEEALLHWAVF